MFRTVFIALFLVVMLASCSPQVKPPKTPPKTTEKKTRELTIPVKTNVISKRENIVPKIEIKKLHYTLYEQGRLKWTLWAKEARFFSRSRIKLYQLKLCAAPDKDFCILANKGDWLKKEGKFVFEGQVKLNTKNRGKLFTDYLVYYPEEQKLKTKAFVKIVKDGLIIKGQGFSYDIKTGVMKVFKKTRVELNA